MYLTKAELEAIVRTLEQGDGSHFWGRVSPNVEWTIMGNAPGAGTYHSLEDLSANTVGKLYQVLEGPLKFKVRSLIVGGDNGEWTTLELQAQGRTKNGKDFNHEYALVMQWNEEGKIVYVRDYLDSALLNRIFEENGGY
ncbi:hypothetical protein F5884DRAFT_849015 [Xylogone sp. PMI_703]|nr:hypothetical protein F5884DRAFT_849015 [Xylogone sp. PMI_703]